MTPRDSDMNSAELPLAWHECQTSFEFVESIEGKPCATSDLLAEIAQVWALPLGEPVEITLRRGELRELRGKLELAVAPEYPWQARQSLKLRIAGYSFDSSDIERWVRV
jgi:hypothetical protein